jgi:hypothetical protein
VVRSQRDVGQERFGLWIVLWRVFVLVGAGVVRSDEGTESGCSIL